MSRVGGSIKGLLGGRVEFMCMNLELALGWGLDKYLNGFSPGRGKVSCRC